MLFERTVVYVVTRLEDFLKLVLRFLRNKKSSERVDRNSNEIGAQAKPLEHQLLERRLLLDAAGLSTVADSVDSLDEDSLRDLIEALGLHEENIPSGISPVQDNANQIYIIDGSVTGVGSLLAELGQSENVYVINPEAEGVSQLSSILGQLDAVDTVHVLSHGDKNEIHLGNTTLS